MTRPDTSASPPPGLPAPARVSALVVGIEWYEDQRVASDLAGAARSAERFVEWLLARGLCAPDRITLLTSVRSPVIPVEATGEIPQAKTEANGDDRRPVRRASTRDFNDWITGGSAPREDDELFLLFWVGHGYAEKYDSVEKLFLLGSDAQAEVPRNVELLQLLDAVRQRAPDANVVAFVNACREGKSARLTERLKRSQQNIAELDSPPEPNPERPMSVVYAAAHGETTRDAGWQGETFADAVLRLLNALPEEKHPRAVFDDGLAEFIERLHEAEGDVATMTIGYRHGRRRYRFTTPVDHTYLTPAEWREVTRIAAAIDDGDADPRPTAPVRWGAYNCAVGPAGNYPRPDRIESVTDLIWALRERSPQYKGWAPPVVIGCDYLANLPAEGCRPELVAWCEQWARGHVDGRDMLDRARRRRPKLLTDRTCVAIKVSKGNSKPGRQQHYSLIPVLWVAEQATPLTRHERVSLQKIPEKIRDAIREAMRLGAVDDARDLLVELIVPKTLRGWRFEHIGNALTRYAVTFRALEIVSNSMDEAATWMRPKLRAIEQYQPEPGRPWSSMIEWFTCRERDAHPSRDLVEARASDPGESFCIGLGHRAQSGSTAGNGGAGIRPGVHAGLDDAIEVGTPMVLSMVELSDRAACVTACQGCLVTWGRDEVTRRVDAAGDYPNGLRDLPYIIRDIRLKRAGAGLGGLQFGVYMEHLRRLWEEDDKLRTQYEPRQD